MTKSEIVQQVLIQFLAKGKARKLNSIVKKTACPWLQKQL